jgi:hypothetical protein
VPDPYRIVFAPSAESKLAGWDISAEIRQWVEGQLRDVLAADPATHLRPGVAPWGERLNLFSPRLPASGEPPVDYIFMFHVLYGDDEATLNVVDCGYLKVNRPT